jgi:undecaprenyl-diphosphatase
MDALDHGLFALWNLPPQAPAWLVDVARFASGPLTWALGLAAPALLAAPGPWRRAGAQALIALAIAWLLARGIHLAWPQPRPFVLGLGQLWVEQAASASFPSRHAVIGMAIGMTLWLAAPRRWVRVLGLAAGLLIGWSRVALGVHFPLDVLAGWALAAAVATAVQWGWHRWRGP